MFEHLLKQLTMQPANRIHTLNPMAGVQICDFYCAPPQNTLLPILEPHHCEALFCQRGGIVLQMKNGQRIPLKQYEILLLSDIAAIQEAMIQNEPFQGILITVDSLAARDSLTQICALLGGLTLDFKQAKQLMQTHQGCAIIRQSAWSDAVFTVLRDLPHPERSRYCTLKATELLYLLCCYSPLLSLIPAGTYYDRHQTRTVQQVHDYMMSSLDQRLTIQLLSQRFHISPTLLKGCFRQLYGQSIHQYLLNRRLEHAAELLSTTSQPILQIASAVGYESVSQFGVAFKRKYHVPPSKYRRMERQKNAYLSHP